MFENMGFDDLEGVVASQTISDSGIEIKTLPAGTYTLTAKVLDKPLRDPSAQYDPNRALINIMFKSDEHPDKVTYAKASWEPTDRTSNGTDRATRLWSNLEQALDMYGAPVIDTIKATDGTTFRVTVTESAMVPVYKLPERNQDYYVGKRGLAVHSEVFFSVLPEAMETRISLLRQGVKLRNFVEKIESN